MCGQQPAQSKKICGFCQEEIPQFVPIVVSLDGLVCICADCIVKSNDYLIIKYKKMIAALTGGKWR